MVCQNVVCVYAQLKCLRELWDVHEDITQKLLIGEMNDAIPKPLRQSFMTFPIATSYIEQDGGSIRNDSFGELEGRPTIPFD
jgi:hypothetical protein